MVLVVFFGGELVVVVGAVVDLLGGGAGDGHGGLGQGGVDGPVGGARLARAREVVLGGLV